MPVLAWEVADRTQAFIEHYSTQANRIDELPLLRGLLNTIKDDIEARLGGAAEATARRDALASLRRDLSEADAKLAELWKRGPDTQHYWDEFREAQKAVSRGYLAIAIVHARLGERDAFAGYLRLALDMDEMFVALPRDRRKAALIDLGRYHVGKGNWTKAVSVLREYRDTAAVDAWRQSQLLTSSKQRQASQARTNRVQDQRAIAMLLIAAHQLRREKPHLDTLLTEETFEAVQYGLSSKAGMALARMSARLASGGGELAGLIRERQKLSVLGGDPEAVAERKRVLDRKLATAFPDYAALSSPEPVGLAELQRMLADNEALLLYFDHPKVLDGQPGGSFLWAVTARKIEWARGDLGPVELRRAVSALRCGLDDQSWSRVDGEDCGTLLGAEAWDLYRNSPLPPFDAKRAHDLYRDLIKPVASVIADKELLIVPSGALTALPFQVLVASPPPWRFASDPATHRQLEWLGARHAMTVLPSVSGLRALRAHARPSGASRAFFGFGDPDLEGSEACGSVIVPRTCPNTASAETEAPSYVQRGGVGRSFARFYRDGRGRIDALRELCPLPDTAYELRCVAGDLRSDDKSLLLGRQMTETAVKNAPLRDYRVIHFATHGLLAGEAAALASSEVEPALVMTPPDEVSETDDGLLGASEVATLTLDADWVVLSACNTAGGVGPGAEALSGLAQSFLYAGARALLVSHWPVNSYAATMLTSRTFAGLRDRPTLSRAQAFREAMLALMRDPDLPWAAHPAVWAPFVIVGEGGPIATTTTASATVAAGLSRRELVFRIKQRLRALRCEPGFVDASWDGLARDAVTRFEQWNPGAGLSAVEPSETLLAKLSAPNATHCAVSCPPWLRERDGKCDYKACPDGKWMSVDGRCVDQADEEAWRAAQDAKKGTKNCFEINGEQICD